MIQLVETEQNQFLATKSQAERKTLGQFFTSGAVATFMAGLIDVVPRGDQVKILDAGAGAGILAYAAALRCFELGSQRISIVAYEMDVSVLTELESNMLELREQLACKGGELIYEIRDVDFVLDRPDLKGERFDIASINPPYFKYSSKDSKYSDSTSDLFSGNPNIYASFMAIVGQCLNLEGQMIAIVPRSFTNGLYFKGFRHFLNETLDLDHIHIFKSRNKLFKDLAVLQENIICKYVNRERTASVKISGSSDASSLDDLMIEEYPPDFVVDSSNDHYMIRIPESAEEAEILSMVEKWSSNFTDNGYFISTGPVVEHRTREFISLPRESKNSVPLIRMHNCKQYEFSWTSEHKKDVKFSLAKEAQKHLLPNKAYMLLKRFSSKEERRRLTATAYDPKQINARYIAIENHLNYIGHNDDSLSTEEQTGLCVLFNSTLMDKYFRCISGNTQVNASEIRLLRLPSREVIQKLGSGLESKQTLTQENTDRVVNNYLKEF